MWSVTCCKLRCWCNMLNIVLLVWLFLTECLMLPTVLSRVCEDVKMLFEVFLEECGYEEYMPSSLKNVLEDIVHAKCSIEECSWCVEDFCWGLRRSLRNASTKNQDKSCSCFVNNKIDWCALACDLLLALWRHASIKKNTSCVLVYFSTMSTCVIYKDERTSSTWLMIRKNT